MEREQIPQSEILQEILRVYPTLTEAEVLDSLASFENMKLAMRLEHQIDTRSTKTAVKGVMEDPRTMLDADRLAVATPESRLRLLQNHGIYLKFPTHALHLLQLMRESIKFVENKILPTTVEIGKEGKLSILMDENEQELDPNIKILFNKVSEKLQKIRDAIDTLDAGLSETTTVDIFQSPDVQASYKIHEVLEMFGELADYVTKTQFEDTDTRIDACSVLRVMKALDYYWRYSTETHLKKTKAELSTRIMSIKESDFGTRSLSPTGGTMCGVAVESNTMREKKPESVLKKLLHAEKYGASPPLDFVGAKIVTESRRGALQLIYKMFFDPETAIFPTSNIQNEHTKNLLFDPQKLMDLLNDPVKAIGFFKFNSECPNIRFQTDPDVHNVTAGGNLLSSHDYRAAHFIVQLPVITHHGETQLIPVEIQITDMQSEGRNKESHKELKARQQIKIYKRLRGKEPRTKDRSCNTCVVEIDESKLN